ncbi:YceI family protein [Spirosoma sp. KNUC1025]|uniref:YceI family protein n=1 Tax=Spirosoma sp. KNUC1025 TaxID=2894082 RepID=UPI00386A9894|nr:YceI family protein [Spirosoma sp. KNUC1025]
MNFVRTFYVAAFVLVAAGAHAQMLTAKSGQSSFFSETPVENISATNSNVKAVLNPASKQIAVKMTMTDFQFPNKLMQEHFNENYIESEKYPDATFTGTINEAIDWSKPGTYPITAKGTMELHGVKQPRTLSGKLTIEPNRTILTTDFTVALVDYKIQVPKLVMMKIAEQIKVQNKLEFPKS